MHPPIPPPIAEPGAEPTPRIVKPRPKGLGTIAVVSMLFTVGSYLSIAPERGPVEVQVGFITLWIALKSVVTWFFWNGHNWARIFILCCAAVSITNIHILSGNIDILKGFVALDLLNSIFMIYWLNTRTVRAYFRRSV